MEIELEDETYAKLVALSEQTGKTVEDLVIEILTNMMEMEKMKAAMEGGEGEPEEPVRE